MFLKSIKLNNIRSYLNQEIKFPQNSVLLAGDIGSGKTTILLAIEFALFGVRRKHLPGESLLRNGKKEGSVELRFDLDGKDIIIKRVLKRARDEVKQDSGYILINNTKKQGTALELKSMILELLGYPKELLTKTKNLVFRYTVYTPQEEMRQILYDDEEGRLDTLRKVFSIDKYKRIRENSQMFIREIKENKRNYEGRIADLEEKKKQKKEREHDVLEIQIKLKELVPNIRLNKEEIRAKKQDLEKYEKKIKESNELKNSLELCDTNIQNLVMQRKKNNDEIELLQKQIIQLNNDLKDTPIQKKEVLLKEINDRENQKRFMEKTILEIRKKINEFRTKKMHAEDIKKKILKIDMCPMCEQQVSKEHKQFINHRENENITEYESNITIHSKQEKDAEKKILELNKAVDELKAKERLLEIAHIKLENLDEKKKLVEKLKKDQDKIKHDVGLLNNKKINLKEQLERLKDIEKIYTNVRKDLENSIEEQHALDIKKISLEKEKQGIEKTIADLEKEIAEKLGIKQKIISLRTLQEWFEKYFTNLMYVMEKHVMLNLYSEFNEMFQTWFNVLIEDETINVRLDDQFAPIVEQNGYDIRIENLSGGEKTSCALAYRVALNKVINDFIGDIKTKDIIILDEPTDGFSSEQLDKIRIILEQLAIKQVIIVSHESKIESFVESVIRINKEEHVSQVI